MYVYSTNQQGLASSACWLSDRAKIAKGEGQVENSFVSTTTERHTCELPTIFMMHQIMAAATREHSSSHNLHLYA